jgi:hypothetical protein
MEDRILLVPPPWAPDPEVISRWPTAQVLLARLTAFWPVDMLRWPSLKGKKWPGKGYRRAINAFRAQLRAEHHVLDPSGMGVRAFLGARGWEKARSFACVGFYENPQTLEARGATVTASATRLRFQFGGAGPSQVLPFVMAGADEAFLQQAIRQVGETLDREWQEEALASSDTDQVEEGVLVIPCLFLEPPTPHDIEGAFEAFRRYALNARRDYLAEFGLKLHEEAGGHELADKVIPFIEGVIAARAGGQT